MVDTSTSRETTRALFSNAFSSDVGTQAVGRALYRLLADVSVPVGGDHPQHAGRLSALMRL